MKGGGEEGSSGGRGGGVREIEGLAWGQGLGEREEKTSRKRRVRGDDGDTTCRIWLGLGFGCKRAHREQAGKSSQASRASKLTKSSKTNKQNKPDKTNKQNNHIKQSGQRK